MADDLVRRHSSTAKKLANGAAWSYGVQVVSIIAQFVYAAFTSRLVSPAEFGEYTVALTAIAVLILLASGGVSQSVARLQTVDSNDARLLLGHSIASGCLFGLLAWILAYPLAIAWGSPAATPALRLMALSALMAPIMGFYTGLCRRQGQFRQLALLTLGSNIAGMAVGVAVVVNFRNATSLIVSQMLAQALLTIGAFIVAKVKLSPRFALRRQEITSFNRNLTLVSLFQYVLGVAPKYSVSHVLGVSQLGQWNRAEVLSILPFQQLQAAILPVIYPEFRHDRGRPERAFRRWADMVALLAWVTVPLGLLGAILVPVMLPFILGAQWEMAALYAIPLCLAGGIQPPTILLASALEAMGFFRVIWIVNGFLAGTQGLAVALVIAFGSAWPAVCALLTMHIVSHVMYVFFAHRKGYLNARRLGLEYGQLIIAVGWMAGFVWSLFNLGDPRDPFAAASTIYVVATIGCLSYLSWRMGWECFPPVHIARRLGLGRRT